MVEPGDAALHRRRNNESTLRWWYKPLLDEVELPPHYGIGSTWRERNQRPSRWQGLTSGRVELTEDCVPLPHPRLTFLLPQRIHIDDDLPTWIIRTVAFRGGSPPKPALVICICPEVVPILPILGHVRYLLLVLQDLQGSPVQRRGRWVAEQFLGSCVLTLHPIQCPLAQDRLQPLMLTLHSHPNVTADLLFSVIHGQHLGLILCTQAGTGPLASCQRSRSASGRGSKPPVPPACADMHAGTVWMRTAPCENFQAPTSQCRRCRPTRCLPQRQPRQSCWSSRRGDWQHRGRHDQRPHRASAKRCPAHSRRKTPTRSALHVF
mmetsp:Transcript_22475/g.56199  ORF Transcript_22475/g.56199 Transcript_22475/m.56199 type:complete len:321 (-) Transcript_22475:34-996(-)